MLCGGLGRNRPFGGAAAYSKIERRLNTTQDIALLTPENVVTVYRLLEQLCERGEDPRGWREFFVAQLQQLFDAELILSYAMAFALDAGNIAPKMLVYVDRGGNAVWKNYIARGSFLADPVTPFIMERFGTDFTCPRDEWVDEKTWRGSEFFKTVVAPSNWDYAIYSQVGIIRPGVVDGIGVARKLGGKPYLAADVAMLRLIHQELARLWRKHDPLDINNLPPRQREVLHGIRRGESRKVIAQTMGVSEHTVHSYEKALFERGRATSRQELQATLAKLVRPALMP